MELLIVIGVLGILAAGLLAAIDPFEQLKKARDTNNRSATIEFLSSSQRYYANHGYLPWFKTPDAGVTYTCDAAGGLWDAIRVLNPTGYPYTYASVSNQSAAEITDCIDDTLGVDGEIKSTFFQGLNTILYVNSGSLTRVGVCFSPESKSNRSDTATHYRLGATEIADTTSLIAGDPDKCPNVTDEDCLQCFE